MYRVSWRVFFIVFALSGHFSYSCSKGQITSSNSLSETFEKAFRKTEKFGVSRGPVKNEFQQIACNVQSTIYHTGHPSPNATTSGASAWYSVLIIMSTCLVFSLVWLVTLLKNGCVSNFIWPVQVASMLNSEAPKRVMVVSGVLFSAGLALVGTAVIIMAVKQLKDAYHQTTPSVNVAIEELKAFREEFKKRMRETTRKFETRVLRAPHEMCKDIADGIAKKTGDSFRHRFRPMNASLGDTSRHSGLLQNLSMELDRKADELNVLISRSDGDFLKFRNEMETYLKSAQPGGKVTAVGRQILGLEHPVYDPPKHALRKVNEDTPSFVRDSEEKITRIYAMMADAMTYVSIKDHLVDMVFALKMIKPMLIRDQGHKAFSFKDDWLHFFENLNETQEVTEWQERNYYYFGIIVLLVISTGLIALPLANLFCVGTGLGTVGTKCFMYCNPRGYKTSPLSDRGGKVIVNSIYLSSALLWLFWVLVITTFVVSDATTDACESYDPRQLLIYERGRSVSSMPNPGLLKSLQPCKTYQDFLENVGAMDLYTTNKSIIKRILGDAVKTYTTATITSFANNIRGRFFIMDWPLMISQIANSSSDIESSLLLFLHAVEVYHTNLTVYLSTLVKLFTVDFNSAVAEENATHSELQASFKNLEESVNQSCEESERFLENLHRFKNNLKTSQDLKIIAKSWQRYLSSEITSSLTDVVNVEINRCEHMYYHHVDAPFNDVRTNMTWCRSLTAASLKIMTFTCRMYFSALMTALLGQCLASIFLIFAVVFAMALRFLFEVPRDSPEDTRSLEKYDIL